MQETKTTNQFFSQFYQLDVKHSDVKIYSVLSPTSTSPSSVLLGTINNSEEVRQISQYFLEESKEIIHIGHVPLTNESYIETIGNTHVLLVHRQQNRIEIYSLLDRERTWLNHPFSDHADMNVKIFQKSRICYTEEIFYRGEQAVLTFFSYLNPKIIYKKKVPFDQFKSQFVQLDDVSTIAVTKTISRKIHVIVYFFEFQENGGVKERSEEFNLNLSKYGHKWNVYDFILVLYIKKHKYLIKRREQNKWQFLILDNSQGEKYTLTPFSLTYYNDPFDISNMDLLFKDYKGFVVFKDGQSSKIVFVDMEKKEVVHIHDRWEKATGMLPKLKDGRIIVEYRSDPNQGRVEIKMTDWALETKNVFLQFLLQLNEDFDDDLLQDSIDLLF